MCHAFRWDQWVRGGNHALLLSSLWSRTPISQEEEAQSPEQDFPKPVFCHCQCQPWVGGSTGEYYSNDASFFKYNLESSQFFLNMFYSRTEFASFFCQVKDKTPLKNKHGEFWLEVKNAVLFSVMQYEGYKDQHYICFHTSSICMYHQGKETTNFFYTNNCSYWVDVLFSDTIHSMCLFFSRISQSVNLHRTCWWGPLCLRHQVSMSDTSPLVRANHLPIRSTSWEILNTLRVHWFGGSQHVVCSCQNIITECRAQRKGIPLSDELKVILTGKRSSFTMV